MTHWGITLTSGSTELVVSRTDLKSWLRVGTTEDDALIDSLALAAQRNLENRWNRSFYRQTFDLHLDALPLTSEGVKCPRSPLASVTSITTYDTDNVAHVMSTSEYRADTASEPGQVLLNDAYDWPTDLRERDAAVIRFVAGYSTSPTGMPPSLGLAVQAMVAHLYEHRGDDKLDLESIASLFDEEFSLKGID